jgi:4-methyl-5(b-hydroxyethyl)-thiazole monophosphate biosynthesis
MVLLAQGCEELEAVTVIDLFRRADIETTVVCLNTNPVKASRGVKLVCDAELEEVKHVQFDVVVLPGGQPGTNNLNDDPRVANLLREMAGSGKITAAICAAPKVLANAGLLKGKLATC